VAVIGTDLFGDVAVKLYAEEGVGTAHLRRTPERNTGVGFITLNAAGQNHIVLDMGANHLLSPADVDQAEDLIASSQAVLSVLEIAPETAARALQLGRQHGVTTLLNPAPAQPLDDALLGLVDVLTPNESELRLLCGRAPDDPADTLALARELQERGVRDVVVTLGEQGALIVTTDGEAHHVLGQPVNVVDTTGAGDAFTCALATALAEGEPLITAVRFGTFAGALACTRLGVIPALPHRQEVEAMRF
jgi:ribokinase